MLKLADYAFMLKNILNKGYSIVFSCNCEVEYSGRAESFLSEGDRIILLKSDNTILVHQPNGNNPVNYMKPGSSHSLIIHDDKFVLRTKGPGSFCPKIWNINIDPLNGQAA